MTKLKARQLEQLLAFKFKDMRQDAVDIPARLRQHRYYVEVTHRSANALGFSFGFQISCVPINAHIALKLARVLYPRKRGLQVSVSEV